MAWTQTDIDRLKAAIASGTKEVEFHDGQTRNRKHYQTTEAMLKALVEMEAEAAGANAPQRVALTEFSRD